MTRRLAPECAVQDEFGDSLLQGQSCKQQVMGTIFANAGVNRYPCWLISPPSAGGGSELG